MKTAFVLAVAVLANSFANICLSKGMKQYGYAPPLGGNWLLETGRHMVSNGWLIAGLVLLVIFLAAYLTALSWADLSFVLPATAPVYLLTAGLSRVFLHEDVSPARWAGTALIVAGTWLVARTYSVPAPSCAVPDQSAADPAAHPLRSPAVSEGGAADRRAL